MSILDFDRNIQFSGLQEVPGQRWLVLNARELRFALFDAITSGFVRMVLMLLGEVLGLIKSLNPIYDAILEIQEALKRLSLHPAASLSHVINALQTLSMRHVKDEYLKSALTELISMRRSVGVIWDYCQSDMMQGLLARGAHTVIRTHELDHREELLLLAWTLLYAIESGMAQPRDYVVYFILDECQHLFNRQSRDSNLLRTLKSTVLTARHPGVALIAGSQIPSNLEPELLASASTLICTGLQDNSNIWCVANAMGITYDQRS